MRRVVTAALMGFALLATSCGETAQYAAIECDGFEESVFVEPNGRTVNELAAVCPTTTTSTTTSSTTTSTEAVTTTTEPVGLTGRTWGTLIVRGLSCAEIDGTGYDNVPSLQMRVSDAATHAQLEFLEEPDRKGEDQADGCLFTYETAGDIPKRDRYIIESRRGEITVRWLDIQRSNRSGNRIFTLELDAT